MYASIYEEICNAGLAKQLHHSIHYDCKGEIFANKEDAYGLGAYHRVTVPEYIIFVDEAGCNTSEKNDGHAGGKIFL